MSGAIGGTDAVPTVTQTGPCPPLRSAVELARVQADGASMICVYDPQDPAAQIVVSEPALLLASLLDGERTVEGVRAAFVVRTGMAVSEPQVADFVRQLDQANLLHSDRYRARLRESVERFRRSPTRAAAHAGGAYPADAAQLRRFLDARWTARGGPGGPPAPPSGASLRGLIAPHIDLHRGGHSYAWGYRALAEREPAELYVLLGTCHTPMETPFAATAKAYETPFGPVAADRALLHRLAGRAPFDLYAEEYAHRSEHALEFQALYLRYVRHAGDAPDRATVVPILCIPPSGLPDGATPRDAPRVHEFLVALRETLAEDGRRVCLIAGADFAHVGPQFGDPAPVDRGFADHVRAGDAAMLECVARGDADGFYRQVVGESPGADMAADGHPRAVGGPRRICGLSPMYAFLWLLGPSDGQVLHYDQWIDRGGAGSVTFGCVAFP